MKKYLLLGNGGREAVMAEHIAKEHNLYAILPYANPSIVEYVEKSGGTYIIGNPFDKELVRKFMKENNIGVCVISSDNLQQEGLNDLALEEGVQTFGATSKGAKIEWSKTYALDIVEKLAPEMIIKNYNIQDEETLKQVIDTYNSEAFVVKPEGLTGGKGVKVGGDHFDTKQEGFDYAHTLLKESGKVIIQDKVQGEEFTVMGLTDGENVVITPIIFDYPYRLDGDKGPGTGGMGTISFEDGSLPFLEQSDIDKCEDLIRKTVKHLNKDSLEFTGVLYGGFFKCVDGIKFIEFNARFGDPESMNVLNLLETPFTEVVEHIINGTLSEEKCKFRKQATCLVYVVSPDYAIRDNSEPCIFTLDKEGVLGKGAKIYFASTKHIEGSTYSSVGNSRLFAVIAEGDNLQEAKEKAYSAIEGNVDIKLHYRKDIGVI